VVNETEETIDFSVSDKDSFTISERRRAQQLVNDLNQFCYLFFSFFFFFIFVKDYQQ
jgi:hypothetical protein